MPKYITEKTRSIKKFNIELIEVIFKYIFNLFECNSELNLSFLFKFKKKYEGEIIK